ncbi:dihydrofolate reductase family protein [Salinisphaera sp. SPP-AMP-43]|uniref:dihydrofolate reductase family protein n=1 Tax=Salinisphaera sp. SPP-AMP-43 TaxID=3121288 RepID=UPI003C6DE9CF
MYCSLNSYCPYFSGDETSLGEAFTHVEHYVLTRGIDALDRENSHRRADSGGPDLIIQSSSTLYPALLDAGLLHRVTIRTYPVILGRNKRLFRPSTLPPPLHFVRHTVLPKGAVIAHYEPRRSVETGSFAAIEPSKHEKARQERI